MKDLRQVALHLQAVWLRPIDLLALVEIQPSNHAPLIDRFIFYGSPVIEDFFQVLAQRFGAESNLGGADR